MPACGALNPKQPDPKCPEFPQIPERAAYSAGRLEYGRRSVATLFEYSGITGSSSLLAALEIGSVPAP
jgi:hypothetical protein